MKNMKKIWKIFFIVVLLFMVFGVMPKTYADDDDNDIGNGQQLPEEEIVEVERPKDVENIAIGCPDPGDPRLISIWYCKKEELSLWYLQTDLQLSISSSCKRCFCISL